jgi:hypothetical protein
VYFVKSTNELRIIITITRGVRAPPARPGRFGERGAGGAAGIWLKNTTALALLFACTRSNMRVLDISGREKYHTRSTCCGTNGHGFACVRTRVTTPLCGALE